ncbi:DUF3095 family protein [Pararhizobium sp. PWRC1-1]|uniref:DUF3095 family protein n=1 Tax=Pararhizobium sp. PWRC1-1 TaxID=2804566 RepID=UPI003CE75ED4
MLKLTTQRKTYHDFAALLDTAIYQPLPDEWLVGITDVIDSTSAIASGRNKDVNYAGASAIAGSGMRRTVSTLSAARCCVRPAPDLRASQRQFSLQQTAAYARDSLQLGLRAGPAAGGPG